MKDMITRLIARRLGLVTQAEAESLLYTASQEIRRRAMASFDMHERERRMLHSQVLALKSDKQMMLDWLTAKGIGNPFTDPEDF